MGIIAETTTTRAGGNQGFGLIVPGDRIAPISPPIDGPFHLDLQAPAGIFARIAVIHSDRIKLPRAILRSIGTLTQTRADDGQQSRPVYAFRKKSARPATRPPILARIGDDPAGARKAGMISMPITSVHRVAGMTPTRSIKETRLAGMTPIRSRKVHRTPGMTLTRSIKEPHAAGLILIRSIRSHRVIARKPVTCARGKTATARAHCETATGVRGERRPETVVISSRMRLRPTSGEMR
jgi:hypothetical protein